MSDKRAILKASGILSVLTLLSRFTGLFRDMIVAALFGTSRISDVFWFAFEIPNLARRLLGEGSLSSFIVPVFADRRRESDRSAWVFVNRTINLVTLGTLVLTIAGMIFSLDIFKIVGGYGMIAKGRTATGEVPPAILDALAHGAYLTRIMFPHLMILAVGSIMMGICNALGSFTAPALGSTMLNVAMIAAGGAAMFIKADPKQATVWLAWSVVAGAILRILIMSPTMMKAGWRWRAEVSTKDTGVVDLFRMLGTGLFGLSIYHINSALAGILAAFVGAGTKTFLINSQRLIQFPMALTAAAMATAMLPRLTDLVLARNDKELGNVMGFMRRVEIVLMTPAALGLMFFGLPILQMLLQHGKWTELDSLGTYSALFFYAPGLLPQGWLRLILPLYYAQKDVMTPVKAAFVSVIVNLSVGAFCTFVLKLDQVGLAIGGTLSSFADYFVMTWHLKHSGREVASGGSVTETLLKSMAAGLLSIGGSWLIYWELGRKFGPPETTIWRAIYVLPLISIAAVVYFVICHFFKVPDSDRAFDMLRRRLMRKKKPA